MRLGSVKKKPVILVEDGSFVGYIQDMEIDFESNKVEMLVLHSNKSFWWRYFFPKEIVLPLSSLVHVGDDVILVKGLNSSGEIDVDSKNFLK